MFRTFNMGIGLICVIPAAKLRRAQGILTRLGEPFYQMGETTAARRGADRVVSYTRAPGRDAALAQRRPAQPA